MSDIVFEDPYDFEEPSTRRGDIVRMSSGEVIECECGKGKVTRKDDVYKVDGPMYHTKDSSSEWLVCPHCGDRIKIHPIVDYGLDMKGGLK